MNRVPLGTQYGWKLLGSSRPVGGSWISDREFLIVNCGLTMEQLRCPSWTIFRITSRM